MIFASNESPFGTKIKHKMVNTIWFRGWINKNPKVDLCTWKGFVLDNTTSPNSRKKASVFFSAQEKKLPSPHVPYVALRKLYFHFLLNCMGYDHGDSFLLILDQMEIVVTVFHSTLNQMEIHLVQNRKENCHHDHIRFNLKGNGMLLFSVKSLELFRIK